MASFRLTLWSFVVLAALLTGFLGWVAVRRGLAPLKEIREKAESITATIYLKQLKSDQVQIDVSGKIYEGEWSTIQCTFDTCPEKYKLLTKRHRAHSHSRAALLKATDGSQLECEWISHQAEIDGVCLSADGQKLRLKEYNARKP